MTHEEIFTDLRPLLFTIAYEITGSVTDADDVLQESYLRWAEIDLGDVRDPRSYLARVVSRQSLNALRAASRRREQYVGPWLPEPLLVAGDSTVDAELAESVSAAMLVVLETLSPDERAVFVLREVFGFTHEEIADVVGKSVPAVRQIALRARNHVNARRRRFDPPGEAAREITSQFLTAASGGDLQALMDLLAPDVVLISDGGGKVSAARRPVEGASHVARFVIGIARGSAEDYGFEYAVVNGTPAVVVTLDDAVDMVAMFRIDEGKVASVYLVRNPDKLANSRVAHTLSR